MLVMPVMFMTGDIMFMTGDIMFLAAEIKLQPTQLGLQLFERLPLLHLVGMVFQIAAPQAVFFPENVFCRAHIESIKRQHVKGKQTAAALQSPPRQKRNTS